MAHQAMVVGKLWRWAKVWKEAQGLGVLGQSSRRGLALKERRVEAGGRWARDPADHGMNVVDPDPTYKPRRGFYPRRQEQTSSKW